MAEMRGNKCKILNISDVLCKNWIIRETGNVIIEVGTTIDMTAWLI
jgi:hypothetical protein